MLAGPKKQLYLAARQKRLTAMLSHLQTDRARRIIERELAYISRQLARFLKNRSEKPIFHQ